MAFEIDDLLPIVDAAQLLGFLKVEEGDAAITPSGEEFANSEILRQKELFRNAAIENVLLLRQIRRALDAKSDHTVPEDFFLDMLDEQFSEEESQRQIETAVNWGRYAELFDFDAARRRFVMPDALEEAVAEGEESEVKLPQPFARSLVTVRTWPFFIDLALAACALALFFAVVSTGVYWFQKPIPVVPISSSFSALPVYAFYSIVRMAIAYCSAWPSPSPMATSPLTIRASSRGWLQCSTFCNPFPCSAFCLPWCWPWFRSFPATSSALRWASFCSSLPGRCGISRSAFTLRLKSIPREMIEASRIYRYSGWQRFWQLEMPFSTIGLVWNSIVSVAGGWFALIFCETFTMGESQLPTARLGQLHPDRNQRTAMSAHCLPASRP